MFNYFLCYVLSQMLLYLVFKYSRLFNEKEQPNNTNVNSGNNETNLHVSQIDRLKLDNKLKMLHCLSHLELYINDIKCSKHYQFNDFEALKQQTQKSVLESVEKLKL